MSDIKPQPYTPEELHEEANANGRIVGENTAFVNKYRLHATAEHIRSLKEQLESFGRCEDCNSGEHLCREYGGGRGWVEFECLCSLCPTGTDSKKDGG